MTNVNSEQQSADGSGPLVIGSAVSLNNSSVSLPEIPTGAYAKSSQPLTESAQPVLYDADANQRIPFSMERDGVIYDIAYILGPQKDTAISEYDRLCDRRLFAADEHETGERNALESTDRSFEAALWLFNDRLVDVDGFGEEGEEKPDNWREMIGSHSDKAAVIDKAYLAADIAPVPPAKPGQRLGWKKPAVVNEVIKVRALFEGYELVLTHERQPPLSPEEVTHFTETLGIFKSIMKQRWLVEGTRAGRGETRIPPKSQALGAVYDRLGYRTTGYKGRVPSHHKSLVVIYDLSKEADAVRKK